MLTSPREARIAACAVVVLAAGVAVNVAFLQGNPRERRAPHMPVGVTAPPPGKAGAIDARRPTGSVTLSLASLIEADQPAAQTPSRSPSTTAALAPAAASPAGAPPASEAAAPVFPGRMVGIARSIDRLVVAQPETPPPNRQQDVVRQAQSELTARGYAPGPADGDAGMLTRAAILAFEHDRGLPATAEATDALLQALRMPVGTRRPTAGADWRSPSRTAVSMVRTVQQNLIAAGYLTGAASGNFDARTIAAIRAFETANDLLPTGRISAPLVAKLQRAGASRSRVAASGQ
jgi:peptidoglycan hydrolase-like protein with peptidoglycan-binding domain